MKISITAHHVSVTDALKEYAEEKLSKLTRYFDNIQDVFVDLRVQDVSKPGEQQVASATVHAAGAKIHAEEKSKNMYNSIDGLESKLTKQLKKHKEKLRDNNRGSAKESGAASPHTISRNEQRYIPKPLEIEMAAEICEEKKLNFLLFRNIENERICLIHKTGEGEFEVIET
jgi:putative sigma-54 modulation protein